MVKTHRITGLKYLCQTAKKNPYKYKGSGKYWVRHLKVHGDLFDTHVILKCYTKSALKEWGLYYSKLWSIVESKQWANMIPESGTNIIFTDVVREKIREKTRNNRLDPKSKYNSQEYKDKQKKSKLKIWSEIDSVYRKKQYSKKMSESLICVHQNKNSGYNQENYKEKLSKKSTDSWNDPNSGKHKIKKAYIVTDPSGKTYDVFGLNSFCKEHFLDTSTMIWVAKGRHKQHKGWICQYK